MDLYLNNKYLTTLEAENVNDYITNKLCLQTDEYYLLQNGKPTSFANIKANTNTHIILRLRGGKGGFGSMLRAIGAQIEKTTNREACRDLSGRRLRDINEEKRLKAWIDSQNTREQEAADRKQKKLERLCQKPRHEFRDETYDKERSALPERLEDAVEQGLAASSSNGKRKSETQPKTIKKKKKALWVDDGLEDLSSDVTDSEDDENKKSEEDSNEAKATAVNENTKDTQDNQSQSENSSDGNSSKIEEDGEKLKQKN